MQEPISVLVSELLRPFSTLSLVTLLVVSGLVLAGNILFAIKKLIQILQEPNDNEIITIHNAASYAKERKAAKHWQWTLQLNELGEYELEDLGSDLL